MSKPMGVCQTFGPHFLGVLKTKQLFPFIVNELLENIKDTNGLFVGSLGDKAVANKDVDLQSLMPCNIEEADERMFVHVQHAAEHCPHILVKTVDSDVVVITLSAFHRIRGLQELWLEFGVGKHLKYIPIHEIATSLGPQMSSHFSSTLLVVVIQLHPFKKR